MAWYLSPSTAPENFFWARCGASMFLKTMIGDSARERTAVTHHRASNACNQPKSRSASTTSSRGAGHPSPTKRDSSGRNQALSMPPGSPENNSLGMSEFFRARSPGFARPLAVRRDLPDPPGLSVREFLGETRRTCSIGCPAAQYHPKNPKCRWVPANVCRAKPAHSLVRHHLPCDPPLLSQVVNLRRRPQAPLRDRTSGLPWLRNRCQ